MMTYYKVLSTNYKGVYSDFDYAPYLDGTPLPPISMPVACQTGYHFCTLEQLLKIWIGPMVVEVEPGGTIFHDGSKSYSSELKIVRMTNFNLAKMVSLAIDCAEHVLPIWEAQYPDDPRPAQAIAAARAGIATADCLAAADAARAVANASAACFVTNAVWAARDAAHAAADAAHAAVFAAHVTASVDASAKVRAAAQAAHATWVAAIDATYAAWSRAKFVTYEARTAAGDLERQWQLQRLAAYLQ